MEVTRLTRLLLLVSCAGIGLVCGCAGSSSRGAGAGPETNASILADESVQGRVVTVNVALRYVVMDFPFQRLPAIGQRLGVYREGQKIGVNKVTGPMMDTAAAGDILTGQAAVGDTVNEE